MLICEQMFSWPSIASKPALWSTACTVGFTPESTTSLTTLISLQWGGAGATVPLTGFGHTLAKGVEKAVAEKGWLGVFTGGFTAASGGITAAVVFAVVMALIFKPGDKK